MSPSDAMEHSDKVLGIMVIDDDVNFAKTNRWNLQRKQLASLFPVQMLASALPAVNYFVTMLIVSTFVGTVGVASIGFLAPLNYVLSAVSLTLGTGLQIAGGRFLGRGDFAGIRQVFSTSIVAGIFVGAVAGLLTFFFPMEIAGVLGATGELQVMVAAYLKGFAPNFVLLITGSCLILCLQMDNARKFAAGAIGMSLVSNALLSIVFLLVFDWGMFGIGLAISFSNLVLNCGPLSHFRRSRIFGFVPGQISWPVLREIIFLGANAGECDILIALRTIVFNRIVFALGGMVAMSAMTVASCITNTIGSCVECGFYASVSIIASVLVGERDIFGLRRLHRSGATFVFPIYAVLYFFIFVFANPIAVMFGAEPGNVAIYVLCIRIYNLWFLTNVLKLPVMAIYNALGHMKVLFVFSFLGFFLFPLSVMVTGKYLENIAIVASILYISESLIYVCVVAYYRFKVGKFPNSFMNICYIPREFVAPEDVFAYSARNNNEAVEGALKLMKFCLQHGMDNKLSRICSLCFEEVTVEAISRFPEKKRKNCSVEINGLFEKGHLSLLFHDNLPEFDPQSVLKFYDLQHPEAGVGIRMVASLAREMQYNFTVGLNSLTVKL